MPHRNGNESISHKVLSEQNVDALISKLNSHDKLLAEDYNNLLGIVETWAHLTQITALKSTTIKQIRKILGSDARRRKGSPKSGQDKNAALKSSETTKDGEKVSDCEGESHNNQDNQGLEPTGKPKNRHSHGRRNANDFDNLIEVHHQHTSLSTGDECPSCIRGSLYKYRTSSFTTISGRTPLVATRHTQDGLQCNLCKTVFKAPLPAELEQDGVGGRFLYTYSAVAMVSIYRCFAGLPMHRQETIQKALGVEVPDASIYDMCERLGDNLRPIRRYLFGNAANANLFYGDDTGATILETHEKVRENRRTGKAVVRTGCHTTGVIANVEGNHTVLLFLTGIHHVGEVMDLILQKRQEGLPPPIFMGDCISSNTVTTAVVLYAGCNAHAVRRFKELTDRYPEHTKYVLKRYGQIYDNEDYCIDAKLAPVERRDFHRENSRPLLREITEYADEQLELKLIEPNCDLGQAFEYIINNERRLSAFTRHPNAPIDNNRIERALRICIRLRDASHFFRNELGAAVTDTILTVGATAIAAGQNIYDYFVAIQRYVVDVRANPHLWVPWRYKERLKQLTGVDPPVTGPPAMSFAPI